MTRSAEPDESGELDRSEVARVGLCATCASSQVQGSAKASGSRFYRCKRADDDAGYMKYPPIPVLACAGYTSSAERGREL